MPTIKFVYPFSKLRCVTSGFATLLEVMEVNMENLSQTFLDFDTDQGKYKLPKKGKMIMLIFTSDKGMFTTLRSIWPGTKMDYYKKNIGQNFEVAITQEVEKPQLVPLF